MIARGTSTFMVETGLLISVVMRDTGCCGRRLSLGVVSYSIVLLISIGVSSSNSPKFNKFGSTNLPLLSVYMNRVGDRF